MTLDIIYDIDADKSWARLQRNAECFTQMLMESVERYVSARQLFADSESTLGRVMNPSTPREIAHISQWLQSFEIDSLRVEERYKAMIESSIVDKVDYPSRSQEISMVDRISQDRLFELEQTIMVSFDRNLRHLEYELMVLTSVNARIRKLPGHETHQVPRIVRQKTTLQDRLSAMPRQNRIETVPVLGAKRKRQRKESMSESEYSSNSDSDASESNLVRADKTVEKRVRAPKFVRIDIQSVSDDRVREYLVQVERRLSELHAQPGNRGFKFRWIKEYTKIKEDCIRRLALDTVDSSGQAVSSESME